MITEIAENSKREGLSWSRLPSFSEEWINRIRGSADFFGLNYYASRYIGVANGSYEHKIENFDWTSPSIFRNATGLGDVLRYFMLNSTFIAMICTAPAFQVYYCHIE